MDSDEIISCYDREELEKFKEWLFNENVRVSTEKKELEEKKNTFFRERQDFRAEMNMLTQRSAAERQRLEEDRKFFEKKMDILRNGFNELDRDRRDLQDNWDRYRNMMSSVRQDDTSASVFFIGVDNPLALKKRYRDLIKIYHPDNKAVDHDTFKRISEEYEKLREEFSKEFSVV